MVGGTHLDLRVQRPQMRPSSWLHRRSRGLLFRYRLSFDFIRVFVCLQIVNFVNAVFVTLMAFYLLRCKNMKPYNKCSARMSVRSGTGAPREVGHFKKIRCEQFYEEGSIAIPIGSSFITH